MVDQATPGEELPEPPAGATQRLRSELIGRPKCPRHPDQTSSRGCATCGSPICQKCAKEIKRDTWLCPQCFADAEEEMAAQARQSAGLRNGILILLVAAAAAIAAVIFLK